MERGEEGVGGGSEGRGGRRMVDGMGWGIRVVGDGACRRQRRTVEVGASCGGGKATGQGGIMGSRLSSLRRRRGTRRRFLVEEGKADDEARTSDGHASLHCGGEGAHGGRALPGGGGQGGRGKAKTSTGSTPLFMAAQEGHTEVVRFLVEEGKADVDKAQASTVHALWQAAQNGHMEVVLPGGGGQGGRGKVNKNNQTPINSGRWWASRRVQFLLSKGQTAQSRTRGRYPARISAREGHHEVVALRGDGPWTPPRRRQPTTLGCRAQWPRRRRCGAPLHAPLCCCCCCCCCWLLQARLGEREVDAGGKIYTLKMK